jgi:hypothetical protein
MDTTRGRGTRGTIRGLIVGAGILALAGPVGCGFFSIRDPVRPPGTSTGCPQHAPSSPDSVLFNFASAIGCKGNGTSFYEQALGPDFVLVLDQQDVISLQLPDSLTRNQDLQAHEIIVTAEPDSFHFAFTTVPAQPGTDGQGNSYVLYEKMPYSLQFIAVTGDTTVVDTTYSGEVDLTVTEETAANWVFSRWIDHRDGSGNPTLGSLHAGKAPL